MLTDLSGKWQERRIMLNASPVSSQGEIEQLEGSWRRWGLQLHACSPALLEHLVSEAKWPEASWTLAVSHRSASVLSTPTWQDSFPESTSRKKKVMWKNPQSSNVTPSWVYYVHMERASVAESQPTKGINSIRKCNILIKSSSMMAIYKQVKYVLLRTAVLKTQHFAKRKLGLCCFYFFCYVVLHRGRETCYFVLLNRSAPMQRDTFRSTPAQLILYKIMWTHQDPQWKNEMGSSYMLMSKKDSDVVMCSWRTSTSCQPACCRRMEGWRSPHLLCCSPPGLLLPGTSPTLTGQGHTTKTCECLYICIMYFWAQLPCLNWSLSAPSRHNRVPGHTTKLL